MIEIIDTILKNPIATGMSATAIIGGLVYQAKNLPKMIYGIGLRTFTVHMTVDSRDPVFRWIDRWLSNQEYAKRTHRVILRSMGRQGHIDDSTEAGSWLLSPGNGSHWFWWEARLIFFARAFEDGKSHNNQTIEKIEFRTLGRSQEIMRRIIEQAEEIATQTTLVAIHVYRGGWWRPVPGKTPRALESLVLQDGQRERIMADMAWFSGAREWYAERGIPYRRGYLFSGPPGTGKTSIVLAIAGAIRRPVCALNLGSLENDDQLFDAVSEAPKNAIILIEDIDCATPSKSRAIKDESDGAPTKVEIGGVTKAGLLNALDGIGTPDGRIFILTTNYPERLDDALTRPGRADVHERFDYLRASEQIQMATRFYGASSSYQPVTRAISPAVMQAAFMRHPDDWRKARQLLDECQIDEQEAA
ncbi:hypothetical protein WM24_23750 [Burkholderia ubonensis]|uniref:AAA family ATPase n=1 Tax=Burkholderia ubonensis TaxID=101571 RepID=UPI000753F1BF|nr:AAA family ATPase [Burkholderia ubonensis]KWN80854.1 hypothetical protein WM24_23750 [Burkholderia ubonensis]